MSAEPLPTPAAPTPRARRAEGVTRAMLGRPVLSLVPTPSRARRAPFVALILGILLLGLIGLLLLNTASAQDAFRLHRLQAAAANVNDERQALSDRVNELTAPAGLATEAQKLGMVPIETPEFWKPGEPLPPGARVIDGIVIVPAAGPAPGPAPAPAPATTPSVPVNPADAAVKTMPRPGQKPAVTKPATKPTKPSTSTGASSGSSTQPSTSGSGRQTPESRATTGSSTKPSATKPSAGTSGASR